MLRSALPLAGAVVLVGCSGSGPERPEGSDGGSFFVESCNYNVTTRRGASAPVRGSEELGLDPTPRHVHLGFQGDPATSMVVQWRTNDDATLASTVQFGVGGQLTDSFEGLVFDYRDSGGTGAVQRIHEAHLCGLTPDTEYSYRVGGVGDDGVESWSPTYTFRTAPAPGAQTEIVVAVVGDSRGGYTVWQQMANLLAGHTPDLVLFTGDAVTFGNLQTEWESFFDGGAALFAQAPVLFAHGNHEVNSVHFFSQFAMPGDEQNFSVEYGPLHLTVANDSPELPAELAGVITQSLTANLETAGAAPWKVLAHHRSLYSASRHGGDAALRQSWEPIIDANQIDLVLSGHDHNYERSKPMRAGAPQLSPTDGTIYVVSGGAGADLYENGTDIWTEVSEQTHGALIVRAAPNLLELQAFRPDGSQLDAFVLSK